jgi:hypothetical protein
MGSDILTNLADPAILFFVLGLFAGLIRSNLEIPQPIARFLSLYLLMALGFKGGQAIAEAGITVDAAKVIGLALFLAVLVPAIGFPVLRRKVPQLDAAAIAATYGSVSAVTFVAASQFVADRGAEAGGYLTVALVLMETPAIIMAVLLAAWVRAKERSGATVDAPLAVGAVAQEPTATTREALADGPAPVDATGAAPLSVKAVLHEAFTDGAQVLLLGSLVIGVVVGKAGGAPMQPFVGGLFKGLLAFFLLEMGLLVARQLREVRSVGPFLVGFGIGMPLVAASIALVAGTLAGLDLGDKTVLTVLAASASYIVVPAVVRYAIPEAMPSRYLTMALAVTFPFNVIIGIPLYYEAARLLSG